MQIQCTSSSLLSQLHHVSCKSLDSDYASWVTRVFLLATNHLVTVVLLRQHAERRLNNSTAKAQHEMQCRLWQQQALSMYHSSLNTVITNTTLSTEDYTIYTKKGIDARFSDLAKLSTTYIIRLLFALQFSFRVLLHKTTTMFLASFYQIIWFLISLCTGKTGGKQEQHTAHRSSLPPAAGVWLRTE